MKYRADIDGMRGIAVLFVLLCHFSFGLRGGYTGVDVFFVISGWLITSIVVRELELGTFFPAQFIERRIRRLAPALLAMLTAVLVAGWFLIWPAQYREVGSSVVSVLTFSSNLFFWSKTGYFAEAAQSQPLLHTWSLAIEEQYYLFFPFLCMIAFRWSGSRAIYRLIAIGTVLGLLASCYGTIYHRSAAFYLLPSRLWEMGAGGMAVLAHNQVRSVVTQYAGWLSTAGAGLLVFPAVFYDEATVFPGFAAIPSVVGTVLVLLTGDSDHQPHFNRLLTSAPLRFLGMISYSLYLWHWPVLVFATLLLGHVGALETKLAMAAISICLAIISWRWIEQPFRDRRRFADRRKLVVSFFLASSIIIGVGSSIVLTDGAEYRVSDQLKAFLETTKRNPVWCNEHTAQDVPERLTRFGAPHMEPEILVWGDSHAMSVLPGIDSLCKSSNVGAVAATHSSTAPLKDYYIREEHGLNEQSIPFSDAVMQYVEEKRIPRVLLVSTWWFLRGDSQSVRAMLDTVRELQSYGSTVYILQTVPVYNFNVAEVLVSRTFRRLPIHELGMPSDEFHKNSSFSPALVSELTELGAIVINPADRFPKSESGLLIPFNEDGCFYYDAQHLSPFGAVAIKQVFEPLVLRN